jgi:hypothetical protein
MRKYYILVKDVKNNKVELIEIIDAKNVKEARKYATEKYMKIVVSGTHQLIVVGKSGYEQYYK